MWRPCLQSAFQFIPKVFNNFNAGQVLPWSVMCYGAVSMGSCMSGTMWRTSYDVQSESESTCTSICYRQDGKVLIGMRSGSVQDTRVPRQKHHSHLYVPCLVNRGTIVLEQKITFSKLLSQGWKHKIVYNVFVCCSKSTILHWKHHYLQGCWYYVYLPCFKVNK